MRGKYDNNPIDTLFDTLKTNFTVTSRLNYNEIDPMLRYILLNNGCKESDGIMPIQKNIAIIEDYEVCFVMGMIGNDANEFYDFLVFNGKKFLIIFIDYFNFVKEEDLNKEDQMHELKVLMGNSVYYDAIKRIVEVFYLTSEPMPGGLLTTAMATTQRWNQAIIAIHIINYFKRVDENDVSDISMEDVNLILNGSTRLSLYGIRTM